MTGKSSQASADELLTFGGSLGVDGGQGGEGLKSSAEEIGSTSQPGLQVDGIAERKERSETPSLGGKMDSLMSLIESIGCAHKAGGGFESDNTLKEVASSFEFKVNADVAMDGAMPMTYQDVCKFITNIPEAMQKANSGKGVPVSTRSFRFPR